MQSAPRIMNEERLRLAEYASVAARAGAVALLLFGVWTSAQETSRVEHSNAILGQLDDVQRDWLEARVNHRTYLLTHRDTAFASYLVAAARTDSAVRELRALTVDDPTARARTDTLTGALARLAGFRRRASGETVSSPDSVIASLSEPSRVATRAAIDSMLLAMRQTERGRLAAHSAVQHRTARLLLAWAIVAVLLAAFLGISTLRLRRRDARSLLESRRAFRRLSDENPDGVLVHDRGRIVYANSAAEALFGTAPGDLIDGSVFDLVHPDDRAIVQLRTSKVMVEGLPTTPREIRLLHRSGSVLDVEARGAPIRFEQRESVQVVLRDLTARRETERALRLSEQRLSAVLDAMDEGVVLQDRSLAINLWNPAAERILGLSGDQLAGKTSYDPAWNAVDEHGVSLPGEAHVAPMALRTGVPVTGVMGVDVPHRPRVWIRVNAVPLIQKDETDAYAVVVTFSDVTAERAANARMRASEAQYRLLADHSADLISRRSLTNVIEYASPSHEVVLGWTPAELVGMDGTSLMHPEDAERMLSARAAQKFTGDRPTMLTRARHKLGHYVWLEATSAPLLAPDGSQSGFLVSARDVTARLSLEEELQQSQKMEVMGRMASGVAHDFNNLLTVIRSSTELLRLDTPAGQAPSEVLTDIELATDRAAALTTHLLTFSRRQHYAPARLRIAPLMHDAMSILRRIAGDQVQVTLDVADSVDDAWIWADPVRFEQVLVNLVGNAKDAMPSGGTVRVSCTSVALQESVTHRFGVVSPGRYLTVTVDDTGTGMTDDVLSHLFDPFYTTKPQGRGTGLGLSIVYGVVTEAQGTITVTSVPDHGSRFTVYWPRAESPTPDVALAPKSLTPPPRTVIREPSAVTATLHDGTSDNGTVLLVDDDESVRRVVAKQLEANGYAVRSVGNGAAALDLIVRNGERFRVLVTDVRMPEMTGIELVERLIADGIDMPVLLISGQLDAQLPRDWPETSHRRFLPKPISGVALRRALEALLAPVAAVAAPTTVAD